MRVMLGDVSRGSLLTTSRKGKSYRRIGRGRWRDSWVGADQRAE